ncbi:MAG: hypothetical protein J2P25_20225 [Nocardiopsaceae bacterium]|nr:hypothetical protein [Nocardiopsaceae bacterium]
MSAKSRPPMLLVASAALAAEALALLAYTVLTVIATVTNQAYQVSNSVAQIVMQVIMLVGLVLLASGVAKMRPWTRTPSVMVQVLIGFVAIVLLQAHRYDWGAPIGLLAVAGLAGLMTPASLKALARPMPDRSREGKPERDKPTAERKAPASGKASKSGNPAIRNRAGKQVTRRS